MYTLKSIVQRGTLFSAAGALALAVIMPATAVFADSLNPLTERSLLLTSSAPGYQDTDGAGNSVSNPSAGTPNNYAEAGTGPNGKKSGETFSFRVSTDSVAQTRPIKALTFQYCTTAAGVCQAPGDNSGDARTSRGADTASTSDLNLNYPSAVAGTDFTIKMGGVDVSDDWTLSTANQEDDAHSGPLTGKNNFMTLVNTTGISPVFNEQIVISFKATETNYITNPGSGSFFVKINTYDSELPANHLPTTEANIIDGGVTVANVMTDSIHITTKVLETMQFSVGTENKDTTAVNHGTCDPISQLNGNRLNLGNPDAEYSLEVDKAWDVNSYWRLSSNSSGGATVYYSGETLANTVGDVIAPIGATKEVSTRSTEQFGLGFVDANTDDTGKFDQGFLDKVALEPLRYKMPTINPLVQEANYASATGDINGTPTAEFAFERTSQTDPKVIAQNNDDVLSCATAKMRYVANIAADTPAGVYTTKINYLAAPQY